jgi:hypothetical protein
MMTENTRALELAIELVTVARKVMDELQPKDLFAALIIEQKEISPEDITILLSFAVDVVRSSYKIGLFPTNFLEQIMEEIFEEGVDNVEV